MDIVVLAGGTSDEREVSMSSGSQIANALLLYGHRVLLIDLSDDTMTEKSFEKAYQEYKKEQYFFEIKDTPPLKGKVELGIDSNLLDICRSADIVFLALHGGIGENGKLQALFDIYGIKYTGSDYSSSLLAMDKMISKHLFEYHGFDTPKGYLIEEKANLEDEIDYPVVIKPSDNGSSIGVKIVGSPKEFQTSIEEVFTYSAKVLVEEMIVGREFSVGILDESPLPIIELIPKEGFYDYKNKYQDNLTIEITPADISEEWKEMLQKRALEVHRVLGLSVYSRVDFIVDDVTGKPFVIEANSLPGMTPNSLLPKEAKAAGISYKDLCNKIVQLSLQKYN